MEKKYFYAAVIDAYEYSEVTTVRYKNFVDFAINCWGEETVCEQLRNYLDGDDECDEVDWQDFYDDYYGYTTYYFALDEDGNDLVDLEDNNDTLNNFCREHKLFGNDKKKR